MYRFMKWYMAQSKIAKVLLFISFCLFLVLLFIAIAVCVGSFLVALGGDEGDVWYYGLFSPQGKPLTYLFYFLDLLVIIISFSITYRNRVKTSDERGVHFMEDNTFGSSRWMDEKEVPYSFEVSDIADTTTTIYGQLTDNGEAVVGWQPNKSGISGNRNVIIMASMGSGKSFGYVRTELIQSILRGNSFVVTDPSAELYTDISMFCMERGVDVKVLNLAEPSFSEFWDCLEETIDPETERLDSTRLNDFAAIFMQNSGGGDVDFWYNSALNLLKAVIAYAAWKRETPIIKRYIDVYKKVSGLSSGAEDAYSKKMANEMVPFPWCRSVIINTAKRNGYNEKEVTTLLNEITKSVFDKPYTIGQVFDYLLTFGDITDEMGEIPAWHPARTAYLTYMTNDTDAVRKSALQGIQLRFQLFTDQRLKEVLSHPGIHLKDITSKQSAYFVILSDKSIATKPIASLFFSFLFKDAQDVYDRQAQIAKERGLENPCLDLVAMLDEFFSVGIIGGSPESFGTIMSNSRKRHIYISIIVQVYSQIEALYGKEIKDVIQGGCSTLLYLGGNDPGTCEFISEFASGESTVLTESHKQLVGLLNRGTPTDYNVRADRRFLLTIDEARRWKNKVLVVKQGEYPLKLNPFPWIQHPLYIAGKLKPTSVYSNIESLDIRLDKLLEQQIGDPKTYLEARINCIGKGKIDYDTGEIADDMQPAGKVILDYSADLFADDPDINEDVQPVKKVGRATSKTAKTAKNTHHSQFAD